MTRQALAALDWPNLEVYLAKHEQVINFGYLRASLELDAARRLNVSPTEMSFQVRVFSYDDQSLTPELREAMRAAGWEVFTKPRKERTAELIEELAAYERLQSFFRQPSHVRNLDLRDVDPALEQDRSEIFDQAMLLLRVYRQFLTKRELRSIRSRIHADRARMYSEEAERLLETCREANERLLELEWIAHRAQLTEIIHQLQTSARYGPHVQIPDPGAISDEELPRVIRGLMSRIERVHRRAHHLEDIDLDLTDWVNQHFMHGNPELGEAIVYLIGGDFRNHLPAAERLGRYGVQTVLVMTQAQYAVSKPETRRALDQYDKFWLDIYLYCQSVAS